MNSKKTVESNTTTTTEQLLRDRDSEENHSSKHISSLKKYARNLNDAARRNELDPGVGRELELMQLVTILSKRKKSNPILVGEAGVGKSQVVYDLAREISDPSYEGPLKNKEIWEVSTTTLIAGCSLVGMAEKRMAKLLEEATSRPEVILFWDEIHTIVGAGTGNKSNNDLSNMMKPALAGTKLSVIGATTEDEYKIISQEKALNRRFNKVVVRELLPNEVVEVLHGIKDLYERFHGIQYSDEVLNLIPKLSKKFSGLYDPDAAIDLLDLTGALKQNSPDRWSKKGMNVSITDVIYGAAMLYSESITEIESFVNTQDNAK